LYCTQRVRWYYPGLNSTHVVRFELWEHSAQYLYAVQLMASSCPTDVHRHVHPVCVANRADAHSVQNRPPLKNTSRTVPPGTAGMGGAMGVGVGVGVEVGVGWLQPEPQAEPSPVLSISFARLRLRLRLCIVVVTTLTATAHRN
jgi:hypothetical protein